MIHFYVKFKNNNHTINQPLLFGLPIFRGTCFFILNLLLPQQQFMIPKLYRPYQIDESELAVCPYNFNHKFRKGKFLFHVKWCKDRQQMGHHFQTCRWNPLHIVLRAEIEAHEVACRESMIQVVEISSGEESQKKEAEDILEQDVESKSDEEQGYEAEDEMESNPELSGIHQPQSQAAQFSQQIEASQISHNNQLQQPNADSDHEPNSEVNHLQTPQDKQRVLIEYVSPPKIKVYHESENENATTRDNVKTKIEHKEEVLEEQTSKQKQRQLQEIQQKFEADIKAKNLFIASCPINKNTMHNTIEDKDDQDIHDFGDINHIMQCPLCKFILDQYYCMDGNKPEINKLIREFQKLCQISSRKKEDKSEEKKCD